MYIVHSGVLQDDPTSNRLDYRCRENLIPSPYCGHQTIYMDCLEALDDCLFEQMVTSPTRGQNILDLFFTTNPTLLENVSVTPGLSGHDIVLTQVNVKPDVLKQVPRNIHTRR